jgi:anti-sigma regulatory factor (Ser/Thr protein kinase)
VTVQLRIQGDGEGLEDGQRSLRAFLERGGASEMGVYSAELALDELVTNVVKYAYRGDRAGAIDVMAAFDGDEIVVTVEDEGPAFNPLAVEPPPRPTRLEDARVGGYGLTLVRKTSSRVEYERRAGHNRVRVRIKRA